MKTVLSSLALILSTTLCAEGHGTLECPPCSVSTGGSEVIAGFDLEDYDTTWTLVRLVPAVDDLASTPWVNREGIDFEEGQMANYEPEMFYLVEDVPVDWNSQKVVIVLQDMESGDVMISSAFSVGE